MNSKLGVKIHTFNHNIWEQREEDPCKFKGSLGYVVQLSQKSKKKLSALSTYYVLLDGQECSVLESKGRDSRMGASCSTGGLAGLASGTGGRTCAQRVALQCVVGT